jgi:HEPN domain-containing protein
MNEESIESVRDWLVISARDLAAALRLRDDGEPFWAIALYLCQQSAEKAIKGYLIHSGQPLTRTHDVGDLLERAAVIEPGFLSWSSAADYLTGFAVRYRYPGEETEPIREDVDEAIDYAETILRQVLAFLPPETHPDPIEGS